MASVPLPLERHLASVRRALAALVPAVLLAGCVAQVDSHGEHVDPDRLQAVRPGVQNRDDVARVLGSPASTSAFGDESWYYISDVIEKYSIFDSKVTERQVVTVRFDQQGIVKEVDMFGLERGREVEMVDRETPSFGESGNLLDQFMGNIGRFNADQMQQPRRQGP